MSEQSFNQPLEDEISLKDIIDFLMESWKTILGVGLLGLLVSVGFLAVTPEQYEAVAQIQMAQIRTNNNNNSNTLGVNVEEPNLLMARLKLPTTYSAAEIKACSLNGEIMQAESIVGMSNFSALKGVGSIVELKIRMRSKEQAIICAQALFENIRESQNQIIRPYIDEAKILLTKYQTRLQESKSLISRADKSDAALSALYLANRDEVKLLTDESLRLNSFISAGRAHQAKLVSPIYVSETPIFPKKKLTLIFGLLGGGVLGLLIIFIKRIKFPLNKK